MAIIALWGLASAPAIANFVNWENAHVHPLDTTPDGNTLLAVNIADNRLERFDISSGTPVHTGAIPVGLDPVSVRARTNSEAWVVNHISDSVSIVDLDTGNVIATLKTLDEPADVVFAGTPQRAFVSCSQANTIQVFDPSDLTIAPVEIPIDAEDPRAMAVDAAGGTVYVAIFESGNGSTVLGGGSQMGGGFPPNVVSDPTGPYAGVNPPPNAGANFDPPQNAANPSPPAVGLIVRQNASGDWMDDNGGNWTNLVSGPNAAASGRPIGWDLPDRDIAIIDVNTLSVTYVSGLMNICMALAVNPGSGYVTLIGTDATTEIRYEPNLNGTFVRVKFASVDTASPGTPINVDLNQHLTYATSTIPQADRDRSISDVRGIVWNAAGSRGYITGMGSNNITIIDAGGSRSGLQPTIEVGEGPTGVVFNEASNRLYVLNKFDASITTIDTLSESVIANNPFYDPTPTAIQTGRKHLYDTHKNSGLGQVSCASCHIDARMDRLSWDLGDPAGDMRVFNQNCNNGVGGACEDWHPMKGPMTTQTLQDIIGKEPHHWRGDRDGIEEFSGAFMGLLGDDTTLTTSEMQEFEDFLATIAFPPNPFRNMDNTLPSLLPLPGHFTTGRFLPAGQPLPDGDAVNGLNLYRTAGLDGVDCVSCHTLPTGIGSDYTLVGFAFQPIPPGPNGERQHSIVSVDGSTNVSLKTPQLRNMYEKVGCEMTQGSSRAGFGFLHDGSVDSIARFVSEPVFSLSSAQDVADIVAFMLAFSGSDLPLGSPTNPTELPGPLSVDTHAAVGIQTTLVDAGTASPNQLQLISDMVALADSSAVGLIVKGLQLGHQRGYAYLGGGVFQSDRAAETLAALDLQSLAVAGSELTITIVPFGSQERMGIDRDQDGFLDRDELDACSDPANPLSIPQTPLPDMDNDGIGDLCDNCPNTPNFDQADTTGDGVGDACSGAIPTVSTWGTIVLSLLLLTSGTLIWRRQIALA